MIISEISGYTCPRLVRPVSVAAIFQKIPVLVHVCGFKKLHVRVRDLKSFMSVSAPMSAISKTFMSVSGVFPTTVPKYTHNSEKLSIPYSLCGIVIPIQYSLLYCIGYTIANYNIGISYLCLLLI